MGRGGDRRKELQKAEYRNRREGMETGRTEEERSTGGTAVRGEREEGKGKNGKLSSQNRAEADERKRSEGKGPKAKAKGKHRWNSCGSEAGKDERKQTGSQVREPGKKTRETGLERTGRAKEAKAEGRTGEAAVRQKREERKGRSRG